MNRRLKQRIILCGVILIASTLSGCMSHSKVNTHPKKIRVARQKGLLRQKAERKHILRYSNQVASQVGGFGKDTTGGSHASKKNTFVVTNGKQLKVALQKKIKNQPRKIIVDGNINMAEDKDGNHLNQLSYVKRAKRTQYNNSDYIASYKKRFNSKPNITHQRHELSEARHKVGRIQQQHIKLSIPNNTTIIGTHGSSIAGTELNMNHHNDIIRNLDIESPLDDFPQWNNQKQTWIPHYDAINMNNKSKNIWLDHNTFTDKPNIFNGEKHLGQPYYRARYFINENNGSYNVTISNNEFDNHNKDINIGTKGSSMSSSTLVHNEFLDNTQDMPKVTNAKVDILDNQYAGDKTKPYTFLNSWKLQNNAHVFANNNSFIFNNHRKSNSHIFDVNKGNKNDYFTNNKMTINQRKISQNNSNSKNTKKQVTFGHIIHHIAKDFGAVLH